MSTMTMPMSSMPATRAYYGRIHGVPGLAVRVGRLLELWGRRASAPLTSGEVRLRNDAAREAQRVLAERQELLARQVFSSIR